MYSWAWIIMIWSIFENNNAGDDFCENKWVRHIWMPQFNQKKYFQVFNRVKNGSKECLKMQNGIKLHEWILVGLSAIWRLRSAVWHFLSAKWHLVTPPRLRHDGPTPHTFWTRVLHFRVFWKIFSSCVTMKHFPTRLQTLRNLFKTLLGIDVAYISGLSCNKSLHQG